MAAATLNGGLDRDGLRAWLARHDDTTFDVGMNLLALHSADKCLPQVKAWERCRVRFAVRLNRP